MRNALRRAHRVAKLLGRRDLADRATAELLPAAGASIDDADPKPGVALRLIDVLYDARHPDPAVDSLLERARHRYTDSWNVESTIALQRRWPSNADARKALDRELIGQWLDEADRAEPLVALMHREKAANLARQRGLADLAAQAVVAMQSADPPDLARIEVPSSITRAQAEEFIDSLVSESWRESAIGVLSNSPSTGAVDKNRRMAVDLAREYALQSLYPKVHLGGDHLPRYTPHSPRRIGTTTS